MYMENLFGELYGIPFFWGGGIFQKCFFFFDKMGENK